MSNRTWHLSTLLPPNISDAKMETIMYGMKQLKNQVKNQVDTLISTAVIAAVTHKSITANIATKSLQLQKTSSNEGQ